MTRRGHSEFLSFQNHWIIKEKNHLFVEWCNQSFNHKSNLNSHFKLHIGVRPRTCEVCGQEFSRKSKLTMHHLVHTGEISVQEVTS
ncbi:hypothetical protein JTE90_019141 [Oedothorax gibbosus]|uniref:C2H2-type domain-containing protein n=1 Tax=Oedothorax gibbosus TaxID=931172 RepID=A0AAV6U1S3_9ARAC|nr:hypothetical protein JTE90_019141 [Oedothorax gibbosus]